MGGSSLQHCAHVRLVIEQSHLALLSLRLGLSLNRDRREGGQTGGGRDGQRGGRKEELGPTVYSMWRRAGRVAANQARGSDRRDVTANSASQNSAAQSRAITCS